MNEQINIEKTNSIAKKQVDLAVFTYHINGTPPWKPAHGKSVIKKIEKNIAVSIFKKAKRRKLANGL